MVQHYFIELFGVWWEDTSVVREELEKYERDENPDYTAAGFDVYNGIMTGVTGHT